MTAYLVKLDPASSNSVVLEQNFNGVVVEAANVAEAKEMAESAFRVDAADWANALTTVVAVAADFTGWSARLRVSPPTGAPIFDETVDGLNDGVVALAINAAGTGYSANDILTVVGGTFTRAATMRVTTVTTGNITGLEVVDPGEYSVDPSLTANAVTGGGGDATIDLTMGNGEYMTLWSMLKGRLLRNPLFAGADMDMGEAAIGATDLLMTVAETTDTLGDHAVELFFIPPGGHMPGISTQYGAVTDEGAGGAILSIVMTADASLAIPFNAGNVAVA